MELVELGEVLKYEQPTKYIVENTNYNDDFKTPVLTAGQSFLLGYTNETENIFSKTPVIIFDDFTTASKYVDFSFKVKSSAMKILKAEKDKADIRFLFYLLQTIKINNEQHKRYWISKFSKIKILLPPLAEQKRIAAILDEADKLRRLNQQLITKYEQLSQSLFLEMFGDPVTNPKGWEKNELISFGRIVTGNTPSRKNQDNYSSNFIEWIKTDNITLSNIYISKAKEYLSEEGLKSARFVEKGSLLVACIAGSIKSIGRAALTDRRVSFNQQINALEPNENVNSTFLYHLFRNSTEYIQSHSSKGMKRMLSKGSFSKIKMVKPPIELQTQFAERVGLIEAQKKQAQEALQKSEDLFNVLLQKAFKGEL
ncbi:restriction endonuclease subunit S [Tenacibaculum ascidiaceicola]|uniref:restriction endonuclease subunit S n=1 Tax=Tenacibaculum ascidiaceicola TaxID=1699411 RepID=UPI0038942CC2